VDTEKAEVPRLIHLTLTPGEFKIVVGGFLAAITGVTRIGSVTGMMSRMIFVADVMKHKNEVEPLVDKLLLLQNAENELQGEHENCGNDDCPVHGTSETANMMREIFGLPPR
jgi:hypothetical protein